jgi:hypothetical protein
MTMIPKRLLCPTILLGFILLHPPASAQSSAAAPQLTEAIVTYTGSPAAVWRLYNGPLYLGYDRHAQGHPFFESDSLLTGSAEYDGVFFPILSLSYDLVKDIVIIPDRERSAYIQLLTDKLTSFSLGQSKFIYLSPDSAAQNQPEAGYYQLLYNGKARALAKHWKQVQNNGKADENLSIYRQYDNWYLELNNRYLSIRNQNSLLKAFGAGDKGLRNILRSKNISFKKDPVAAITAAAELLSQSNK